MNPEADQAALVSKLKCRQKRQMKIAVWHNTLSGGARRALYHGVKGLIERGHTVESWCPSTADQSYLPIRSLTTEHIVPFEQSFNGSRRLGGRYLNAFARMRAMDKACEQSAQEIRSGNFDVLFATSCIYYSMPFIARYLDMPKVVYLHEPSRRLYEAFPSLPWVGKVLNRSASLRARMRDFVFDQVEMQCLRIQARRDWLNANSCDEMLVNSYYSRENIVRTYGRGAKVCYPGIDTSLFRNLKKPRENFIVGLGAYVATKGIDLALKSIALLEKPRPKLVWISNGGVQDYLEEMIRLASSLGVEFEVKKLIPDAEVIDILNRAALLIYTSQLEPFGLAPLEANACGAPVVAVAEGGVRETIKDGVNGLLVDRDPESVSEAVNKLLRDPQLARLIGERASDHVKREWGMVASVARLENHLMQAARSSLAQKSVAYSAR